jgi:hypothetical protein
LYQNNQYRFSKAYRRDSHGPRSAFWPGLKTLLSPRLYKTNIPVLSLALVRGDAWKWRWLVYAHAPLQHKAGINITMPDLRKITVDVPQAAAFYLIDEADRTTTFVTAVP